MGLILKTKITEQQAQDAATSAETAAQFNSLNQKLQDEAIARENSDIYLTNELLTETRLRKEADELLQANLDSETSLRIAADAKLQQNIDAESLARKSADNQLQQNLDSETSLRIAADNSLQANLDSESAERKAADLQLTADFQSANSQLQNDLNAEVANRKSADSKLQANLNSEIADRKSAVNQLAADLNSKINQEISDRTDALTDLQNAVMVSLGDIQSLQNIENKNLKDAIADQTSNQAKNFVALSNKIDNEINDRKADSTALAKSIADEVTARKAADDSLTSKIEKESTDRQKALTDMQAAILVSLGDLQSLQNIENENLKKSISEQATSQSGSIQTLSNKIDTEIADRKAADSTISTNLTKEISDRKAAVDALSKTVADNFSANSTSISDLDSKVESEISNRTAEDTKLSKSIADEVTARTNAINNLNSSLTSTINSKTSATLSDAKSYTDSVFGNVESSLNDFKAATATANGVHGLVPAPPKGTTLLVLTNMGWRQLDDDAVQIANTPNQANVLTYNGSAQSPTWANFDTSKMSLGGTTSGTNAGSYNATFTPTGLYIWADTKSQAAKTVAWNIGALYLNKPTIATTSFPFDGNSKSVTISNYNSTYMNQSGTTSASAVGNYSVSYTLKNTTNTKWKDSTTTKVTLNWSIVEANLTQLQSTGFAQEGTLTYNGSNQSPTIKNYDSSVHQLGGDTSKSDAGSYTATISPKSVYKWYDGTTNAKNVSWSIGVLYLDKPTAATTSFDYSNANKSLSVSNYNNSYMNQSGTVTAKTAGSYSVTYSLKSTSNTKWKDGTTGDVTINWNIAPKKIAKPYALQTEFTYGTVSEYVTRKSGITFTVELPVQNYDSDYMTSLRPTNRTEVAGEYVSAYSLKDKTNTTWDDGSTDDVAINWKVYPGLIPKPYTTTPTIPYQGKDYKHSPTFVNWNSNYMTANGLNTLGDIYVNAVGYNDTHFALRNPTNYHWEDGTTDTVIVEWIVVEKGKLSKPFKFTQDSYEWTGSQITLEVVRYNCDVWGNPTTLPDEIGYSGDLTAKDIGTYSVTFFIKDKSEYTWYDGTTDDVTLTWQIIKKLVEVPELTQSVFEYTKQGTHAKNYLTYNDSTLFTIYAPDSTVDYSDPTPILTTGNKWPHKYYFTLSLNDKEHTQWDDKAGSDDINIYWEIIPKVIAPPTLAQSSFNYNGNQVNIRDYMSGFDSDTMDVGAAYQATNAGNYSVTVEPKSWTSYGYTTYCATWSDGSTANVTYTWSIESTKWTKPTIAVANLTYNAAEQAPVISNFNSDTMTVSGTQKATNAGDYSLTIALKNKANTTWADGSTDDVTLNWSIGLMWLTPPYLTQNSFDYSDSAVNILDYVSKMYKNVENTTYIAYSGDTSKTDAGNYTLTLSIKDKNNFSWAYNHGTNDVTLNWKIIPQKLTKPTLEQSSFPFTKRAYLVQINGFDENTMTKSGSETGLNAVTYTVTVSLKDKTNYTWSDGSTDDLALNWEITAEALTEEHSTFTALPVTFAVDNKGPVTYDLTDYVQGYNPQYHELSSSAYAVDKRMLTTSASAAGDYQFWIIPKPGYYWYGSFPTTQGVLGKPVTVTIEKYKVGKPNYYVDFKKYNGQAQLPPLWDLSGYFAPYVTEHGEYIYQDTNRLDAAIEVGIYQLRYYLKYPDSTEFSYSTDNERGYTSAVFYITE